MDYRRILHIDLDAFYASVEQRDNPALRGKPIAVGVSHARGVVATASYEARSYGVRSAMPSAVALRLCPHLIFVQGRMKVYREISAVINDIYHEFTDLVEPISIDEAFLDVTENKKGYALGRDCAVEIKRLIYERTGLIASAGVSYNKFLAKIASDWRKPNGLCVIHPSRAEHFIDRLPVGAIWGIGPVTEQKMELLGIRTGAQLRRQSLEFLIENFGKAGITYYNFVRGIDDRPVTPVRERKQVSSEVTFMDDIRSNINIDAVLVDLSAEVASRVRKKNFLGTSLTLKVRFSDFTTVTRSYTGQKVLNDRNDIYEIASRLMDKVDHTGLSVRLLGIAIGSRIHNDESTPDLPLF